MITFSASVWAHGNRPFGNFLFLFQWRHSEILERKGLKSEKLRRKGSERVKTKRKGLEKVISSEIEN